MNERKIVYRKISRYIANDYSDPVFITPDRKEPPDNMFIRLDSGRDYNRTTMNTIMGVDHVIWIQEII